MGLFGFKTLKISPNRAIRLQGGMTPGLDGYNMDMFAYDKRSAMEPSFLVWREVFAVGHAGLDAEHRHLVESVNEIYAAECAAQTPGQLTRLLEALRFSVERHFKHENLIMREMSRDADPSPESKIDQLKAMTDAVIDEHVAEHAHELFKLDEIIRAVPVGSDSTELGVSHKLKSWFVDHAIKYDAHLKAVFQAM